MKKLTKKITAIVGTATLAVGLMALPALAGTTQGQENGWFGQMQNFMQQTFTPAQHQALMNSSAMQNLHNSAAMQKAMQTGDVKSMQDLMNSDPAVKTQIGQDNLNKMNQFMSQFQGNMMSGSRAASSGNTMMNGIGGAYTGSTMMNF
ncbi:hypothetical protein Desaci_0549 [Desulfosporosinus acidiphilus SJ4]|uniref:Uncharacterized protein n=1 Tax=Desulfosporosinus acidiphilus (strain DSM 22704 / JCM 16185 / SJ4) TaxID=646529 RepID=I4D1E0_DESAJ|nr:hypothetical protein [Desulfosporosinus acidiphilus]AFM39614.1 hypothetical protein Desaci_0549 [Desulfosporosinus acidiphilus SJ4]